MESTTNVKSTSTFGKVMMVVLTIIGFVVIYFIYKFLYGASSSGGTSIITKQVPANIAQTNLPAITGLYEGGDYAVSMWIYVTSYNINRNKRKHVLEIAGANFSTLLVALGAFKNTLMIRTQSKDSSTVTVGTATNTTAAASTPPTIGPTATTSTTARAGATGATGGTGPTSTATRPTIPSQWDNPVSGLRQYTDANGNAYYTDSAGNITDDEGYVITDRNEIGRQEPVTYTSFMSPGGDILYRDSLGNVTTQPPRQSVNLDTLRSRFYNQVNNIAEAFQNATPGSSDATRADGSLSTADLNALFAPLAMDDSLLNPTQPCDISTFDMQRWVNVTVVLSGRTIDVYMDGKLARSCVTNSYYKVDPTGVSLKVADRGGFDGYINGVSAFNYPLSPADVYRIYQAGPTGTAGTAGSMVASLFGIGK
jgi:hypothetical protein